MLAVICALTLDIMPAMPMKKMKKKNLFKMREEKSEMLIFVFKFMAFR